MKANYRLEYYDKNNQRHDVLFMSKAMAELKFKVVIESGATLAALSRRSWKELAVFRAIKP